MKRMDLIHVKSEQKRMIAIFFDKFAKTKYVFCKNHRGNQNGIVTTVF